MVHVKAVLFGLTLIIALSCGKKDPVHPPASNTEAAKPALKVDPTKHERFLWKFKTGGSVYSSPAIGSNGTVYVGSFDKKLYAINGKTGDKLWEFKAGDNVENSPAIGSDGTVYIGSDDGKLYAINPKTGDKLWEFYPLEGVGSSPAIGPNGTVYFGSWDKSLYAIETDSSGLAKSSWPMRGQNPQHTGRATK